MLKIILLFIAIYFFINFIKPGQNIELIITVLIFLYLYHYNYFSVPVNNDLTLKIPIEEWELNLKWLNEYNPENYTDIMRGLDHFMELYQDIINTDYKSNQKYDSLQMIKKQILQIVESSNLSIPENKQNQLDKIYELMENQLSLKEAEVGSIINQQWDAGKISYLNSPVFMGGAEPVNA